MIATGPNHEQIFKKAYSTTLSYLHCIGAAISAKKCFTFSTEATTSEERRDYVWVHISARIPAATSFQDRGGHLNSGRLLTSATLTQRILRASALCERLVQMPWSRESKIKIVLTLILPLAFYGAEAAPPAEEPLERLTVAIAKRRSNGRTLLGTFCDCDVAVCKCIIAYPACVVSWRAVCALKRTLHIKQAQLL